jgi:predicted nucleic acid-binding protein
VAAILMDTNLLVYLVDQNEPERQSRAIETLGVLELHQVGRLSTQNLAEFINVTVHKLHPGLSIAQAMEWAGRFIQVWPVFDLTPQIVLEAARGVRDYKLAYYDAQIWATARLNQITLVFSEDFQDALFLEGVRFVNPFTKVFDINQWVV